MNPTHRHIETGELVEFITNKISRNFNINWAYFILSNGEHDFMTLDLFRKLFKPLNHES